MENSRTSYSDIAKAVGLKSPTVIERIKRLEADGYIKNYSCGLDFKKLGFDITAFIGIGIDSAAHISDFEENLRKLDNGIVECHHVTGDYTMIIKVITENTESLSMLIKAIRNIQGVDKTNTILVFSTIMDRSRTV